MTFETFKIERKDGGVLTDDDEMSVGTDRFNAQIWSNLALIFSIVRQRSVCDLQIVDSVVLITYQSQSRVPDDFSTCVTKKKETKRLFLLNLLFFAFNLML